MTYAENTTSQQIGIATKRKQLIAFGVSNKRPKLPSPDTFESCVVCSSPPFKGKPGKKCTGYNSWIQNNCAKLHYATTYNRLYLPFFNIFTIPYYLYFY